jgi:RHS repeat-associated protein
MFTYDAYGNAATHPDSPRSGYTGETRETGLPGYLLGGRVYLPSLRCFISPDSASPFGPGGANRYGYCGGDPVNRIDPTGNAWWDWLGASLGLVAALVATAATAGALVSTAIAAGSLMAAVTSASAATLVAATLDVVSVIAEVGSIASMAAGDETAGGVFGWLAFGTGMASIGMMGRSAAKSVSRRGSSSPRTNFASASQSGRAPGQTRKTVYTFGNQRKITHHEGLAIAGRRGRLNANGTDVEPRWYAVPNQAGGANYVADAAVSFLDSPTVLGMIKSRTDDLDVVFLAGAHGSSTGMNYANGQRVANGAVAGFFFHARNQIPDWARSMGKPVSKVSMENIANLSADEFIAVTQRPAIIVHWPCYSLADRYFMEAFHIKSVAIYSP